MSNSPLTQERLKELLKYDPETGVFTWASSKCRRPVVGKQAGSMHVSGYWLIAIEKRFYSAHRLAWLYVYAKYIDHVNGVKSDNRILNLRECDKRQNSYNSGIRKNNTLGFRGVSINGRWGFGAAIRIQGRQAWIGTFATPEEASKAYEKKAREVHGEFYRSVGA